MTTADYLDRLIGKYSGTFDIYQPYVIYDKEYPAYGYFFNAVEKYVLVREANLWSSASYEHVLFMEMDSFLPETIEEVKSVIEEYMEPVLVRRMDSLPAKNHMYSYLTVIVVCQKALSKEAKKKIKSYKFEKGYQFNMRGYSQAHLSCVSMEDEAVVHNFQGRMNVKLLKGVFQDVRNGQKGFKQMIAEQGLKPFKQNEG